MKFELRTENEDFFKSFSLFMRNISILAIIIILCDISLKLGNISNHYQIEYNCRLLSFEKSISIFKRISNLSNLKSKQRIWEFCQEFVK